MKTGSGSPGMKNAPGKIPATAPGANTGGKRSSGIPTPIPGSKKATKSGHPGGKTPALKVGSVKNKGGSVRFANNPKQSNRQASGGK